MQNPLIQCTRCKHKSSLAEWPSKNTAHGWLESVCPRCGCKTFYDLTPWFAWAWRDGSIEMGPTPPKKDADGSGVIVFAKGPRSHLQAAVGVFARQGRDVGQLLVPGVPEAEDGFSAIDAFSKWVDRCATRNRWLAKKKVVFSRDVKEFQP